MNKRSSHASSVTTSLLCLAFALALPGACASERNTVEDGDNTGATSASGKANGGKASGGNAGKSGAFGGSAGSSSGGSAVAGTGNVPGDGGETSGAGAPSAGSGPGADKCKLDSDCTQVSGSCFVCEAVGAFKDCVDHAAPVCDTGTLDPCEVCEVDDTTPCVELG
jgi:hypothetical protein